MEEAEDEDDTSLFSHDSEDDGGGKPAATSDSTLVTKRARVDESSMDPADDDSKTPIEAANALITSHIESLHNGLAMLLSEAGPKYIVLSHKAYQKMKVYQRMENDEEYVPVSARIKFSLNVVKEASEDAEYKDLVTETKDYVKEIQKELKKRIIQCAKIEFEALLLARDRFYCETVYTLAILFLTLHGEKLDQATSLAYGVIRMHPVSTGDGTNLPQNHLGGVYVNHLNPDVAARNMVLTNKMGSEVPSFMRILANVFQEPWEAYLRRARHQETVLTLKKLTKEHLQPTKTEEAVKIVEGEIPTDRKTLDALIRREATRIVQKQAASASKNTPSRGRGGASNNKKKTPKPSQKSPPAATAPAAQKAGGKGNATRNASKNKGRNRSRSRSRKKNGATQKGRKQS